MPRNVASHIHIASVGYTFLAQRVASVALSVSAFLARRVASVASAVSAFLARRVASTSLPSLQPSRRSSHGAAPQRRFRRFSRLGVPRTARCLNVASFALSVSVASPATTLPPSTTFLVRRTPFRHDASSVSASNVSKPEQQPSPAVAHVLTRHVSAQVSHSSHGTCDKRLALGAAMHGDAPSTYTLTSVCYLLASVSQILCAPFLATPTSREGSNPCCHIWRGMCHWRSEATSCIYYCRDAELSSTRRSLFGSISLRSCDATATSQGRIASPPWPTYRTMYSTGDGEVQ